MNAVVAITPFHNFFRWLIALMISEECTRERAWHHSYGFQTLVHIQIIYRAGYQRSCPGLTPGTQIRYLMGETWVYVSVPISTGDSDKHQHLPSIPSRHCLKNYLLRWISKKNYCEILDRNYFRPKRETAFFWILTESYAIWYLTHNIYFQLSSNFFPAKYGNIESRTIPPPSF